LLQEYVSILKNSDLASERPSAFRRLFSITADEAAIGLAVSTRTAISLANAPALSPRNGSMITLVG
jgi:hypothetical protein